MMNFNLQKIIALTIGILVLAVSANYIAFAWTDPSQPISLPIDVSDSEQEKEGALTVASFILSKSNSGPESDKQVFLNADGSEGDIHNINYIRGYNDLFLLSEPTGKATMYLDEDEGIKFYTGGVERMVAGSNNNIYISNLDNCFLKVNSSGKIECYAGSNPPDGKFRSTQAEIMRLYATNSTDNPPTENPVEDFRVVIDEESVVKILANAVSVEKVRDGSCIFFPDPYIKSYFYIKEAGSSVWDLKKSLEFEVSCWNILCAGPFGCSCKCEAGSKSETWYYHLKQGDEIKITTQVWETDNTNANLSSEVLGYNLTFKRQIVNYVFTDPGHSVLHYFDKNTTGPMISTPDAYWIPTPTLMTVTADDAPISVVIPPE